MAEIKSAKSSSVRLLLRIARLALPYKSMFVVSVVLTILLSVLSAIQPYLYQQVIDRFIIQPDTQQLTYWAILILGLLLFQSLLGFITSYLAEFIGQNVIFSLRQYVYRHLLGLKASFFDKTPVGTAVTRTISDIETISELFASGLITISGDLFQIAVILILMFSMNWQLALLSLTVLPLLLWASNKFRKAVRDSFQDVRSEVTHLNSFLQEHITGMQIVQIFNREKAEFQKFKTINGRHRDANIRSVFYYAVFFPVVDFIVAITLAIILWYGTFGMLTNRIGFGELTAFIMFINLFFRPIRMIADRFNNIQMGMVAADRIFQLIDDKNNIETGGNFESEAMKGLIEFRNVCFSYNEGQPVINNLSFTVQPGQSCAVVGHTGSGKTTLINLLGRFYTHQEGEIFIDGIEISRYKLSDLRKHIAVVLQDVFLFSGSVADNITLKDTTLDLPAIIDAAKSIGAYDFISKLPGGFEFNVMERGMSLSMGQRQLISFIRALAFNPSVIILDEATSSIDSETEELIQKAIESLLKGRTSIVIAHRLSTIKKSDKILVLEKGRKIEEGTHLELLGNHGVYAGLYLSQLDEITT